MEFNECIERLISMTYSLIERNALDYKEIARIKEEKKKELTLM